VSAAEVGPVNGAEIHFGVSGLQQQKVAEPAFAGGADDEVGVGEAVSGEVAGRSGASRGRRGLSRAGADGFGVGAEASRVSWREP